MLAAMGREITLHLTEEAAAALETARVEGGYASLEAVVEAALAALEDARAEAEEADLLVDPGTFALIRARYAAFEADPHDAVPLDQAFAELQARIAKRRG